MTGYDLHRKAAAIVKDAGGELIGRTRLQKITYLSQLAGFPSDFPFEYRHYGPYSEELAEAMEIATGVRIAVEEERPTNWGGWYSVYSAADDDDDLPTVQNRTEFLTAAAGINAIELELAATAAFLYTEEGIGQDDDGDPWSETELRKPDKAAHGNLDKAKKAYKKLAVIDVPSSLPQI